MFTQPPALTLPFLHNSFSGRVRVYYEANTDPKSWGFNLLNLPFDLENVRGFPVCEAQIDYDRPGYYATMGWIQLVTVKEDAKDEAWVAIDKPPNQYDLEHPFMVFGQKPTMFDAPGPNPPRSDETWLAETFLVACPDVARTRTVEAIVGFSWGYRLEQMRPTLLPLEVCKAESWNIHLPHLEKTFPSWSFLSLAYLEAL